MITFSLCRICKTPVVAQQISPINITAGRNFSFTIPEATFSSEDGNTRSLSLNLRIIKNELPQNCWFSFNPNTQTIDGLIHNEFLVGLNSTSLKFEVIATDKCGLNATTELTFILTKPRLHCLELSFDFNTTDSYECEYIPIGRFVEYVAQYFGFSTEQDISIINYSRVGNTGKKFTVKISVLQSQISCIPCDFAKIATLKDQLLHLSDKTIRDPFKQFLSPAFDVTKIDVKGIDACAPKPFTSTQ